MRKLERREQPRAVEGEKHQSKGKVSPTAVMKREPASPDTQASQVDGEASSVAASASAQKLARREQPTVADEKHQSNEAMSPTRVAKRERISNRTHVSKVDRDATLVNRAGYPMQLYHKVHYCIDASSRVITDCHVTTGADHENTVIRGRIEYQQARFGFPIEEVIADAGYSSGKNYQFFEEQQICSYIPMPRHAKPVADNGSFEYDPKQDHYTCQAGHVLELKHAVRSTKYYYIKKAHCKNCQWQSSCYLGGARACIARNKYKPAIERVQCRQDDRLFQQRLAERSWKVEGLFGEAKEQNGLRRAKYRGLEKVRVQAYLTGTAQNLKRLAVSLDFYFCWLRFQFIQRFLLLRYSFQG